MTWRAELIDYVRGQAKPEEKFGHQPRLYALTLVLGEGLEYDDDIVFAAAWLHDLGVFTGHRPEDPNALAQWDNTAYAIAQAPAVLERVGFPLVKCVGVLEAIRTHQPAQEPASVEAIILRDADILEQLGGVGALRTICKVGRDTRFHTFTDAVRSLEQAVRTLPGRLKLPRARALAAERVSALEALLGAIEREAGDNLY